MRVFRKTRGARIRGGGRARRAVRRLPLSSLSLSRGDRPRSARSRGGWSPRVRSRRVRLPRAVLVGLACVPGLIAVLLLVVCAVRVGRTGDRPARPPVAARPAVVHPAAKPPIVPRSRWLDAESTHDQPPARYDDRVVAVFVHHTDSPNGYDCADAPRIIRYLYAGQTGARQWDDIGYNFLVDRCGTIYEGRAGVSTGPSPGLTRRASTIAPPGSRRSVRSRRVRRCRGR